MADVSNDSEVVQILNIDQYPHNIASMYENNEEGPSRYDEPVISESINTPDFTNMGINERNE